MDKFSNKLTIFKHGTKRLNFIILFLQKKTMKRRLSILIWIYLQQNTKETHSQKVSIYIFAKKIATLDKRLAKKSVFCDVCFKMKWTHIVITDQDKWFSLTFAKNAYRYYQLRMLSSTKCQKLKSAFFEWEKVSKEK